jgi:Protein of unknown function (DUF1631)
MPTVSTQLDTKSPGRDWALYQAVLQEAAAGGSALMGKLVEAAGLALQQQQASSRDSHDRDNLATAASQLLSCEQQLCRAFPAALLKAFSGPEIGKKSAVLSVSDVHFDQLERMDDTQVLARVTLARLQQSVLQAAGANLSELNTLICSVLGMGMVRAEHNPLRPEIYVNALKEVVEQTQAPASLQLLWFNTMAAALGAQLHAQYAALSARLRKLDVVPVAYASPAGFASQGGAVGAGVGTGMGTGDVEVGLQTDLVPLSEAQTAPARVQVRGRDEVLLTLDKLRQLLSGELNSTPPTNRMEQFAAQFAVQFDGDAGSAEHGPRTDFDATVPAALEALTEMKQVDRVVQSLQQRRNAAADSDSPQAHSVEGQRLALRRSARDIAQALSLEVVTLMVDNMARDPRLLEPVRQVVRNLEPPLLRLALVDPRFFTNKQHPARRLLHALTHRSLAFESTAASGFDGFLQGLQAALAPLLQAPIESAEVFEAKLEELRVQWSRDTWATKKDHEVAVDVLQHAEARNLLAEKIARGIASHPDSTKVAPVVIEFLCGPWAQVVAQARIKQGARSVAAERFDALIPALLWSAHPELARSSPAKLTRVVPRLLATLREGLETIRYPVTRTSVFLEALMAIHQRVFHAEAVLPTELAADAQQSEVSSPERVQPGVDGNPWIAPEEALASNFVELQDSHSDPVPVDAPVVTDLLAEAAARTISDADFALGSWVEMWVNGRWQRTQLTWASPHGTLFLFTGVFGTTQSMNRRSRDKLLATGRLRLVSGQAVDEEALNAVAQTAMRNSLDHVL